jgi:ATP-binding cassette, subfamily B, bacterial MsbA
MDRFHSAENLGCAGKKALEAKAPEKKSSDRPDEDKAGLKMALKMGLDKRSGAQEEGSLTAGAWLAAEFGGKSVTGWQALCSLARDHFFRPHRTRLALGVLCMMGSALTMALLTTRLKPVFDDIFIGHRQDRLFYVAGGVFILCIVRGICEYGSSLISEFTGQSMMDSLQKRLFGHMLTLDLEFFRGQHEGRLTALLLNDVRTLRQSVLTSLSGLCAQVLLVIGLLVVMVRENVQMTLLAGTILPLVGQIMAWCGRRVRSGSRQLAGEMDGLHIFFQQVLQNIMLIKAQYTQEQEAVRLDERLDKMRVQTAKVAGVRSLVHPMMELLGGAAIVAVIFVGGSQVIEGKKTAGSFFTFLMALLVIYRPLKLTIQLNSQLQEGMAAAERVHAMLSQAPMNEAALSDQSGRLPSRQDFQADLCFRNVNFAYPTREGNVLENLDFCLPAGKTTAIVGPSGAGKSTLFALLMRFYRPTQGQITLGDVPIDEFCLKPWRQALAFVSQESILFDDTVAANMAYGMNVDKQSLQEAARLACADEFIHDLPDGYQTIIGARGAKLSGGQRQRIALARAFLRDASLVLQDEPTSALDSLSESSVKEATARLCQGRTTLIIAHRLATIEHADHVIVLSKGRVVQQGAPSALMACDGLYRRLALAQKLKDEGLYHD